VGRHAELPQVALAFHAPRGLTGGLDSGQEEGDEDADDGDDYEELDEGEAGSAGAMWKHSGNPFGYRETALLC
jgi:hypothetical protein